MRVPSSTPAGMLTWSERCFSLRPSPRHFSHGSAMILADAAAARAGPLHDEEALLGAHLAAAVAHRAGAHAGAGLGAPPLARLALDGGVDAQLDFLAEIGVLETDLEVVAQVRTAQHIAAPILLAAHEFAEDVLEDVGEGAEILAPPPPAPPLRNAAWPKRS
jgi:hypothetical protein